MQVRGSRQTVTGLVVNEKVNIKSEYYRTSRAMCDQLFQTGKYYKDYLPKKNPEDLPEPDYITSLSPLEGILSHIYNITQNEERRTVREQRENPRAIRELYRRFLFYKNCVALDGPLIITEGKTDPIYLREAIRARSAHHPKLGKKTSKGFSFSVNFFNYEGQAHEIMDLGGGTGDLKSIILDYLRNFKPHKKRKPINHRPLKHPVIIILDNDNGLEGVAGTIKKNFSIKINKNTTDNYYHITENLYLIKVPESDNPTSIEDLLPEIWLKKPLNGKTFSKESDFDTKKHFGKEIFAKSVIKLNSSSIDFSGFDPLLDRIVDVIDKY
ncbi:hypothetical protein B932_1634 [Gluconobacter oxydans H24]|uniref:hypothetical protein n=1 Tax=Gluconobacter thailandicus TaxID=257438 RepID=UPI000299605E|nr:hypothetical protein [Gluconobacter thailandicus]AFW01212.1 hypothetical protein B932_1634 [Gluconobacter oxydans H24]